MNMESNKILAALLVAGIVAGMGGFIAREVIHPEHLEEDAYKIEVAESAAPDAAAAPAEAEPIDDLMASANSADGEKISKICAACHTFGAGEPNKVGPNLHGIIGAHHAHKDDYAYSDAMKAMSGETWDVKALNKFLWAPGKTIKGTKMTFAGLKKPEDRAALIKWLETQK